MLGDRIGIMAEGALRCCGTPMFLKHRYGVGYSLTAVKEAGCNSKAVTAAVRAHVPELKVLSDVGAEISFQLPLGASRCRQVLPLGLPSAGWRVALTVSAVVGVGAVVRSCACVRVRRRIICVPGHDDGPG